jgi:hypothetical protein
MNGPIFYFVACYYVDLDSDEKTINLALFMIGKKGYCLNLERNSKAIK